jgi:hypothetical protein
MARQLARAVSYFLEICPSTVAVHDLATKVRIELVEGYLLDLYFNAPHHPEQPNYPHHRHMEDGGIEPTALTGDPEQDIIFVTAVVNSCLL